MGIRGEQRQQPPAGGFGQPDQGLVHSPLVIGRIGRLGDIVDQVEQCRSLVIKRAAQGQFVSFVGVQPAADVIELSVGGQRG